MNGLPQAPKPMFPPVKVRRIRSVDGLRTKNPFYYLSGSISATQKRRRVKGVFNG